MKKNTRKSTALISLVLVPMNLLGLGFTGGCDSRDDAGSTFSQAASETDQGEVIDFDARDPDDVYNLDPVNNYAGGPPAAYPATQPLASSGFATQPAHHSGTYTHYHGGGGFIPIPYRTGYRPVYRGAFRPIIRSSPGYSGGGSGSRSSWSSGSSYSRSSSGSSYSHSSSSVSRGGFGSSGHASSSS